MDTIAEFLGFSRETVRFLTGLRRNNDRAWFEAHREDYERHLLEPSQAFVVAMGGRLRAIAPNIVAVPRIDKSIFRLNRDTRFSSDSSPYKTNLGIFFWEGRSRMESAVFYFHLEPPKLMLGGGAYAFGKDALARYRRAVLDSRLGRDLARIVAAIRETGRYEIGGRHSKRVPAGFDPEHPNAELLKHNGLYAGFTSKIPDILYSAELMDHCVRLYEPLAPLHRWLVKLLT